MALARYVLPVPGGPANSRPRFGLPPISLAKVRCARNRLSERTTSSLVVSAPATSTRLTLISSGRNSWCGERPEPMNGPIITRVITRPSTIDIVMGLAKSMWGRPSSTGFPTNARINRNVASSTNTQATRSRRRRRYCSRCAVVSLSEITVVDDAALRRSIVVPLIVRPCDCNVFETYRGRRSSRGQTSRCASHATPCGQPGPFVDLTVTLAGTDTSLCEYACGTHRPSRTQREVEERPRTNRDVGMHQLRRVSSSLPDPVRGHLQSRRRRRDHS